MPTGGAGVHEDLVKSDAAAAVQSIPAYVTWHGPTVRCDIFCMARPDLARVNKVEAANLFIALVPSLKHQEILGSVGHSGTTKLCNSNAGLLYHGTFDHFVGIF